MRLRRFLPVLALLLSCPLLLTACAPAVGRDPFAYANEAFSLSVEGVYHPTNDPSGSPRPFTATVTVGADRNRCPSGWVCVSSSGVLADRCRRDRAAEVSHPSSTPSVSVAAPY